MTIELLRPAGRGVDPRSQQLGDAVGSLRGLPASWTGSSSSPTTAPTAPLRSPEPRRRGRDDRWQRPQEGPGLNQVLDELLPPLPAGSRVLVINANSKLVQTSPRAVGYEYAPVRTQMSEGSRAKVLMFDRHATVFRRTAEVIAAPAAATTCRANRTSPTPGRSSNELNPSSCAPRPPCRFTQGCRIPTRTAETGERYLATALYDSIDQEEVTILNGLIDNYTTMAAYHRRNEDELQVAYTQAVAESPINGRGEKPRQIMPNLAQVTSLRKTTLDYLDALETAKAS
jgi:hypothetical protein